MDVKAWQILAGLTVVIVVYWLGIELSGAPGSAVLLVVALVFGTAGILIGRRLVERAD